MQPSVVLWIWSDQASERLSEAEARSKWSTQNGPVFKRPLWYRLWISHFSIAIYDYDHMLYNCLNFLFCIILSHFALTCSWHEPLLRLWLDHITFRQPYHHGQVLLLAKERLEANLSSTLVSGSGQVANNDPQLFRAAGRSCLLKWLNVTRFRVDFNVEYHKWGR